MDDEVEPSKGKEVAKAERPRRSNRRLPRTRSEIQQPNQEDIILGRGILHIDKSGNRRYYELLDRYMPTYNAAPTKGEKTKIVREIYQQLQQRGARFLTKAQGGGYSVVEPKHAKKKISHAIRYRKRNDFEEEQEENSQHEQPIDTGRGTFSISRLSENDDSNFTTVDSPSDPRQYSLQDRQDPIQQPQAEAATLSSHSHQTQQVMPHTSSHQNSTALGFDASLSLPSLGVRDEPPSVDIISSSHVNQNLPELPSNYPSLPLFPNDSSETFAATEFANLFEDFTPMAEDEEDNGGIPDIDQSTTQRHSHHHESFPWRHLLFLDDSLAATESLEQQVPSDEQNVTVLANSTSQTPSQSHGEPRSNGNNQDETLHL